MDKKKIKSYLQQESFVPSKKMGQNFLSSMIVKKQIVAAAKITPNDLIIEIGPGLGAITELLITEAKDVVAIELDKRLCEQLNKQIEAPNLKIINDDILTFDLGALLEQYQGYDNIKVVANLPYSISTKIIFRLMKLKKIDEIIIMVQKEMAERITAKPHTRDYNAFTVLVSLFCCSKKLFLVKPECFVPAPRVDSMVISLTHAPIIDIDVDPFYKFVKSCFLMKRKKLTNNLKPLYPLDVILAAFKTLDINVDVRPEVLDTNTYMGLYKILEGDKDNEGIC